jgi:hypothetical protein
METDQLGRLRDILSKIRRNPISTRLSIGAIPLRIKTTAADTSLDLGNDSESQPRDQLLDLAPDSVDSA